MVSAYFKLLGLAAGFLVVLSTAVRADDIDLGNLFPQDEDSIVAIISPDEVVIESEKADSSASDETAGIVLIEPASLFDAHHSGERDCSQCFQAADPAPKPWKVLFFNNDFSYKNFCNAPYLCGEEFKDIDLGECCNEGTISFGGEIRFRHMNEFNRLRPGGPDRSTYDLWRWRNYIDYRYSDALRGYVEVIDASIFNEDMAATGIDLNRWDILNAFVDLRILQTNDRDVFLRFGRQELLYGAQRLVSPLDWSNTRRNFQGFNVFSHGKNWDIDAWAVQPVNTAAGNGPLSEFDNGRDKPDGSRYFSGVYATNHGVENQTTDLYWMWDRDSSLGVTGNDRSRHLVGARWAHDHPILDGCGEVSRIWHTEIEGGYQFGHDSGNTVKAGFLTAGAGHTWKSMRWSPSLWLYYDWASGDDDPNDGETNTFQQLFPLGHKYMGWIDNLARQNVSDVNLRLVTSPSKKLNLIAWMHWMDLATDNDVIYNVAGVPLGTRNVGDEIGEELDLLANYQFNANFEVQVGYFWFWYGSAVENSALSRDDASQFYVQSTLRY